MKLIIWGYKSGKFDTFRSVFYGLYKAASYMTDVVQYGQMVPFDEVYWFDDYDHPKSKDFDYTDCIFITEGNGDKNIPIEQSSTYFVHVLINPEKYLGKVKKLIDIRYNCYYQDLPYYNYVLDHYNCEQLGPTVYFETGSSYNKVYMSWATDLLPHEFEKMHPNPAKKSYFIGTRYGDRFTNNQELNVWENCCQKNGIQFVHIDPWINPVSWEDNKNLINASFLSPDLRGPDNISKGYIPCRIFKNISYGALGLTNSLPVHMAMNQTTLYCADIEKLFNLGLSHTFDKARLLAQQDEVSKNHTYINRVSSLMKAL